MNSTYQTEHIRMFEDLKHALKMDMPKLALEANGGRSILFVYPPCDDEAYIAEAIERFSDSCEFIDLRSLLTEFMNDMGLEEFTRLKAHAWLYITSQFRRYLTRHEVVLVYSLVNQSSGKYGQMIVMTHAAHALDMVRMVVGQQNPVHQLHVQPIVTEMFL